MTIEIRMEAIGGQGAHSAGRILAEAAVLEMGYSGNHFSSFGSEKRGSPVRSHVRLSKERNQIRTSAPILRPDYLIIFHESLLEHVPQVLDGCHPGTDLLVNAARLPDQIPLLEGMRVRQVACIDALKIARNLGCGVNTVLLGAFASLCLQIQIGAIEKVIDRYFVKLTPEQKRANRAGLAEGQKRVRIQSFVPGQSRLERKNSPLPRLGWKNAPIGGLIPHPGNTVIRDLSASRRGIMPELDLERCIHCGLCDMVCPDYCFVWRDDPAQASIPLLQGIDYQYCKGCQKCVVACPMNALTAVEEKREISLHFGVKKFEGKDHVE